MLKKFHFALFCAVLWFACQAFSTPKFDLEGARQFYQTNLKTVGLHERYALGKTIISCGITTVYQAYDNILHRIVAVKMIDFREKTTPDPVKRKRRLALEEEGLAILMRLDHPNIIKVHEVYHEGGFLSIVTDLLEGQELSAIISKEENELDKDLAREIFRTMAKAIQYVHDQGIMIRDVKPENFKFETIETDPTKIMAFDFGFATMIPDPSDKNHQNRPGSLAYAAPEILADEAYNEGVDTWAFVCTLYVCILGEYPFGKKEKAARNIVARNLLYSKKFESLPHNIKNLFTTVFATTVKSRPKMCEILDMEWFKGKVTKKRSCTIL